VVRVFLIIAFLAAWFLPLIIAGLYKLPHQGPIAVLSLLLGWTGVAWLAALIIAVGGAIRATRPAAAGQGQPQAPEFPRSQAPAQAAWSPGPGAAPPFPAAQPPGRAQSPERAPSPWPEGPR
jgi:hypothetical protein